MAIQFPNFLSVPVTPRDYSGIADSVENYYKGYNMPKDALIKEIQAKFAQPNAEADLQSTQLRNAYQSILNKYAPDREQTAITSGRLGNRKTQMDIDQAAIQLAQQKMLEAQLRQALGGGSQGAAPSAPMPQAPMPQAPAQQGAQLPPVLATAPTMPQASAGIGQDRILPGTPQGIPIPPRVGGMTMVGSPPVGAPSGMPRQAMPIGADASAQNVPPAQNAPMPQGAAPTAATVPEAAAVSAAAPEPLQEVVVAKGSPQLAGIDAMYDSNPVSRAFLEKKGYKKTQEVKFDNKTGRTTIITKYPSGKVTVQASSGAQPSQDGIPLTSKMVSKHQGVVASVDVAVPVLKQLADLGSYPRQSWYRGGQYAEYEGLVNQAVDSVLGSFGLPMTNEGLKTIRDQIDIKTFETPSHYKTRINKLIKDLRARQSYSAGEVKKSNKIQPIDTSDSVSNGADSQTYSPDEWEPA